MPPLKVLSLHWRTGEHGACLVQHVAYMSMHVCIYFMTAEHIFPYACTALSVLSANM